MIEGGITVNNSTEYYVNCFKETVLNNFISDYHVSLEEKYCELEEEIELQVQDQEERLQAISNLHGAFDIVHEEVFGM